MTDTDALMELLGKATPGPWLVSPFSARVDVPDRDAPICELLWPTDLRSEDETFSNGRLIALAPALAREVIALRAEIARRDSVVINDIGVMMLEFVENWPEPKQLKTALALVAKTIRTALNLPRHYYWGAGEPDCPRDIKAGNGELHTLRCKVCGEDDPISQICRYTLTPTTGDKDKGI